MIGVGFENWSYGSYQDRLSAQVTDSSIEKSAVTIVTLTERWTLVNKRSNCIGFNG